MRRRLIEWCVVVYPQTRRDRDGEVLRDLAMDLSEHHGLGREVLALLHGGLAERVRTWSVRRRAAAAVLLAAAITAVAVPTAAGDERVESEQFACAGPGCRDVESLVTERERDGWACVRTTGPGEQVVGWRCTLT